MARTRLKYALICGVAVALALPALGQDGPESLLPPGFGTPPPPPPPATQSPSQPSAPSTSGGGQGPNAPSPGSSAGSPPGVFELPSPEELQSAAADRPAPTRDDEDEEEEDEDEEGLVIRFDVPPSARRSLDLVGVVTEAEGGYPADLFAGSNGPYLLALANSIRRPSASRWATIVTRRALATRAITPPGISGQDWVARRAWLTLRMGDAPAARALLQQVDAGNFSRSLYETALPVYLANGDPAGTCALVNGANNELDSRHWKVMRAICAGLAGEQGRAMSFLTQTRVRGWATGIDYLLAEKVVGAAARGGRAVKIEWDGVSEIDVWRHGLALTVGLLPPAQLYEGRSDHLRAWLATAPMLPAADRTNFSMIGASRGVLSNRALVDLYSRAAAETDDDAPVRGITNLLEAAYTGNEPSDRLEAIRELWQQEDATQRYAMEVLTARAAALLPPDDYASDTDVDRIVSSMLTAGFDTQAARWAGRASSGSMAAALLAVGAPGNAAISRDDVENFRENDESSGQRKSQFLVAALAGLGRLENTEANDLAADMDFSLTRASTWTREIDRAAQANRGGAVILLTAAGLQTGSWSAVPARHLYRIVRALKAVGLESEARMIAAEAIRRG